MSSKEDPLILNYWDAHYPEKTGKGALVLDYHVIPPTPRNPPPRHSKRRIDALIFPDGARSNTPPGLFTIAGMTGQSVVVIQAKAHRLGMCLMGQVLFSPALCARRGVQPVKTVAICGANDPDLAPLFTKVKSYLKQFYCPVEIWVDPQEGTSPERENPLSPEARVRIKHYYETHIRKSRRKGTIIWRYPLTAFYSAHAVILPDEGDGETELAGLKVPLTNKRVVVVHSTPRRLGMYVMGQAVFSAELLKNNSKTLSSVLLCRANDEILYPLLEHFTHVEVVPADNYYL